MAHRIRDSGHSSEARPAKRKVRVALSFLAFLLIAIGCSSPTVPKLPTEEEEEKDPEGEDPDGVGFLQFRASPPILA